MRALVAAITAWALATPSAQALSLAILEDDSVPRPGHVREQVFASYTPYALRVIYHKTYMANPEGSAYNATVLANQFEVGLLPDASLGLIVPYGFQRLVDPGLDPVNGSASGIGDVGVTLSRKVWSTDRIGVRMRVGATYPSGNAEAKLGSGVPQVSLDTFVRVDLDGPAMAYLAFADYTYGLRRLVDNAAGLSTQWMGHQAALSQGVRWTPFDLLTLSGLAVMDYFGPAEADRTTNPSSGAFTLALAPSAQLNLVPGFAFHLTAAIPIWRTGFQDSDQYSVMSGVRLDF